MCDLFTCGCERACHAVESDSPNGLVTLRISDLETISCIIHSIRDTHLCARQSVRTSAPRFFGPSDLECPPPPLLSSSVCPCNKFTLGYGRPAHAGMGWHPARASHPDLFLTF